MSTLSDTLLDPTNRSKVIDDCCQMVADEVRSKRGLTGLAVKAAFKTVRAFRPNIIESVIEALLEDFVTNLEPIYEAFQKSDSTDLNRYCVERSGDIADALLSITDGRAERSKLKTLVKAYQKLRPQGRKHVQEAVPRIAGLLNAHGL